jgi:hypothetical protein
MTVPALIIAGKPGPLDKSRRLEARRLPVRRAGAAATILASDSRRSRKPAAAWFK